MSVEKLYMYKSFTSKAIFFPVEWQVKERSEIEVKKVKSRFFSSAFRCHAVWTKITSSVEISSNKLIQHLHPESGKRVRKYSEVAVRYQ